LIEIGSDIHKVWSTPIYVVLNVCSNRVAVLYQFWTVIIWVSSACLC